MKNLSSVRRYSTGPFQKINQFIVSALMATLLILGGLDTANAGKPSTTLDAPTSLTATVNSSSTQINLSWNDNSGNEQGFEVQRSINSTVNFVKIGSASKNRTSYAFLFINR